VQVLVAIAKKVFGNLPERVYEVRKPRARWATASQKVHRRRLASSFLAAAYFHVRFISQDLSASGGLVRLRRIYPPLADLSASGGFAGLVPPGAEELVPSILPTFYEVIIGCFNSPMGGN
jgi:hypothetical protein